MVDSESFDLTCESALNFGRWLVVHPDLLGTVWSVRIAGVEVAMVLPRAPGVSVDSVVALWPLLPPENAHTDWLVQAGAAPGYWGDVSVRNTRDALLV